MSEGALKFAVHRLRKRFTAVLEEEIDQLFLILSRQSSFPSVFRDRAS